MGYAKIRKMDVSNGPGIRVSIFMQGCAFHCKNCFNSETWDFTGGEAFTDEVIEHVLKLCGENYIKGLSILGGEPLHPTNIAGTTLLAKKFKEWYPNKSLWLWTGFSYEEKRNEDIFNYVDVLVDGRFIEEFRDLRLKWCGSSNQRVIDIQETKKQGKMIIKED